MEIKTIIFGSEPEFRDYVIRHSKDIIRIVIFEDKLDNKIFFYCFMTKRLIVATSEPLTITYEFFHKAYITLANSLNLQITSCFSNLEKI